jgi:hypothetical protein
MRAYMSRRSYGQKTLSKYHHLPSRLFIDMSVAEIIFSSISPLFLINSLVDLWQRHMETRTDTDLIDNVRNDDSATTAAGKPVKKNITWVKIVSAYVVLPPSAIQLTCSVLKLVLLVAFATAIAAGVLVGRDLSQERQRKVITNLLKASYIMTLGKLPLHLSIFANPQPSLSSPSSPS